MKNPMIMKSILAYSIVAAGVLFMAAACSESSTPDSKVSIQQENRSEKIFGDELAIAILPNEDDDSFLRDAAEIHLEAIHMGKMAQKTGNSSHVIDLGKMMEENHTESLNELKSLARSKSISIPNSISEDSMEASEKLKKKSGNDFGKAYSDMVVESHKEAIELFEKASTESEDSQIRAWTSQQLPGLKTHLKHAEECKRACDKMKS